MTRGEAIKEIESRLEIDRQLLDGDTESDYAEFVLHGNEAITMALNALKTPERICCGGCEKMIDEDIDGCGWCELHDRSARCYDGACDHYTWKESRNEQE